MVTDWEVSHTTRLEADRKETLRLTEHTSVVLREWSTDEWDAYSYMFLPRIHHPPTVADRRAVLATIRAECAAAIEAIDHAFAVVELRKESVA